MKRKYWPLLLLSVLIGSLFALVYIKTLSWLNDRYQAPDSYYSHGLLVPLISAFLIWRKRAALRNNYENTFNEMGLVLVACSLLVHVVSTILNIYFVSSYSIMGIIFGISIFLLGIKATKQIMFPLFFIFFMLPLPQTAINVISFPLKMFVTKSVVWLLRLFMDVPIRNEGFIIYFPRSSLLVENPCSGLRSLIVVMALGSIFAYLLKSGMNRKIILFTLSIPIAVVANIFRVLILALSVFIYGEGILKTFFHDLTGYLVFLLSFFLLSLSRRKLIE